MQSRGAFLFWSLTLVALLLAGCGRGRTADTTRFSPIATPIATFTPEPVRVTLTDSELLGAPGIITACDYPQEAEMRCQSQSAGVHMEVNITASTFARWSLRWENADAPLTGEETLVLSGAVTGSLAPRLYLVERNGRRVAVELMRYGLADGTARVPLAEVRYDAGDSIDAAEVVEVQIVFEWADMQGALDVESVRFARIWEEEIALSDAAAEAAGEIVAPEGFIVEPVAENLPQMTQIQFAADGSMFVGSQDGRIWRYGDSDGDGAYDVRRLFATGFTEVVGLLVEPGATPGEIAAVWVGGRGQLFRVADTNGDGVGDDYDLRVDGLPWGRHQNNGLAWNPQPDPFSGEAAGSWIYFGLGSTDDLVVGGELNATILRFPREGRSASDLEVVSRGVRNAYDVTWARLPLEEGAQPAWHLFASENGPDFNDAPDEVNHIRWGRDYGFPEQFGPLDEIAADGDPYSGPVYPVTAHASADGLAFVENLAWPEEYRTLYVSLFGEVFSPTRVGHTVERITLEPVTLPSGERTFRGTPSDFLTGLDRPLPLAIGPDGNLIVGDYATGIVYRVRYTP